MAVHDFIKAVLGKGKDTYKIISLLSFLPLSVPPQNFLSASYVVDRYHAKLWGNQS